MDFELDEYYFNRAGDKVKYVGRFGFFKSFRDTEGNIYSVNSDGTTGGTEINALNDITGKWEITDDPDRVYVIKGCGYSYGSFGLTYATMDDIEKILINPRKLTCLDCGETMRGDESLSSPHYCQSPKPLKDKPEKIKPMDILDGASATDLALTFKINELITKFNETT